LKDFDVPAPVSAPLLELRQALVDEAIELLVVLDGTATPSEATRLDVHASVHRLAGGLGFFGLHELGGLARDIDVRMASSCDHWPLSEIVELLSTIERSLQQ
jgi:HPt (histidine-containing phosphotransfer) domain-containing protein